MEAISIITVVIVALSTLVLVSYHIFSYVKVQKANKGEIIQIVKFKEKNLIDSETDKVFLFEKVKKENEFRAKQQTTVSGSIRLAADLGFDYDSFLAIRDEEFSHKLIGDDLGTK